MLPMVSRTEEEWKAKKQESKEMMEAEVQADMDKADRRKKEDRLEVEIIEEKRNRPTGQKKIIKVKTAPICIIGDSMIRQTPDHVKCSMPGNGCTSMGDAQI